MTTSKMMAEICWEYLSTVQKVFLLILVSTDHHCHCHSLPLLTIAHSDPPQRLSRYCFQFPRKSLPSSASNKAAWEMPELSGHSNGKSSNYHRAKWGMGYSTMFDSWHRRGTIKSSVCFVTIHLSHEFPVILAWNHGENVFDQQWWF